MNLYFLLIEDPSTERYQLGETVWFPQKRQAVADLGQGRFARCVAGCQRQSAAVAGGVIDSSSATERRPLPAWLLSHQPECEESIVAVLARARQLITVEQRWCQGAFARGWF